MSFSSQTGCPYGDRGSPLLRATTHRRFSSPSADVLCWLLAADRAGALGPLSTCKGSVPVLRLVGLQLGSFVLEGEKGFYGDKVLCSLE